MQAVIHPHVYREDGCLWATVDEFPGVFAAGDNIAELRESLEEGIALWVAATSRPPAVRLTGLYEGGAATCRLLVGPAAASSPAR